MRCTSCGRLVRPVVALDIDGTLGDYHGHFARFVGQYTGTVPGPAVPFPGYTAEVVGGNFGDWICFAFGIDRRTYRDIKLAYRQGAQKRTMPAYPNADRLAAAAVEAGAEVWVATSRPYMRLDNIDPDTRHWLSRNGIRYHHLTYGDDKYHDLAQQVEPERVVFVLDDLGELYDQARAVFPTAPVLRKNRWNSDVTRPVMVSDLLDARAMMFAHIQDWKIKHEFDNLPTTGDTK